MLHLLVFPQRLLVFDTLQRAPEVVVLDVSVMSMSGGEAVKDTGEHGFGVRDSFPLALPACSGFC